MSVMRGAIVTAIREQYGVSVPGVRLPEASSAGVTGLIPARDRGARRELQLVLNSLIDQLWARPDAAHTKAFRKIRRIGGRSTSAVRASEAFLGLSETAVGEPTAGQWKAAADLADVLLDNHEGVTGRAYLDAGRLFARVLHPHYSQVHLDKLLERLGDSRRE
ncbi:hypothetical protein [Streptomyces sp. NPDC005953]|uniref:hypothetical protein n=1 Tax=Streptomyces sp. NPDC005953 TaxID=3156719 RepID=UPI0033DCE3B5